MHPQKSPIVSRAFSLVEILVSVSIIAVLAALLVPMIGKVRANAQQVQCLNNLRAWGGAILAYAAENDGAVQHTDWANAAQKNYESYLGGTGGEATQKYRRCPVVKWNGVGSSPSNYAMVRPSPVVSGSKFNLRQATQPMKLLLMTEISGGGASQTISTAASFETLVKPVCVPVETGRHRGNVNLVFGDGHAETLSWSQLDRSTPEETTFVENMLKLQP